MLISSSGQQLQAILPDSTSAAGRQGVLAEAGGSSFPANPSAARPSESKDEGEGARVTLSTEGQPAAYAPEFAPVYVEIWKGGMKVAEIDFHGGVSSMGGLVASTPGTVGGSGVLLAARRAAEIVRSIGGEIRVGGQTIDTQTLDMRSKLKIAYCT